MPRPHERDGRAAAQRLGARHRREDAVPPRRVVRRRDHAAAVRVAADDERAPAQLGALQLLHGGEEGVQVEVGDDHGLTRLSGRPERRVSLARRRGKGGTMDSKSVISQLASLSEDALGEARVERPLEGGAQGAAAQGSGRAAGEERGRARRPPRGAREARRRARAEEGDAGEEDDHASAAKKKPATAAKKKPTTAAKPRRRPQALAPPRRAARAVAASGRGGLTLARLPERITARYAGAPGDAEVAGRLCPRANTRTERVR